jgi:hypothetical protein
MVRLLLLVDALKISSMVSPLLIDAALTIARRITLLSFLVAIKSSETLRTHGMCIW